VVSRLSQHSGDRLRSVPRQSEIVEAAADRLMAALAAHPDIVDPTIGGSLAEATLEVAFSVQIRGGLYPVMMRQVPAHVADAAIWRRRRGANSAH
jgi:hypothetical protein